MDKIAEFLESPGWKSFSLGVCVWCIIANALFTHTESPVEVIFITWPMAGILGSHLANLLSDRRTMIRAKRLAEEERRIAELQAKAIALRMFFEEAQNSGVVTIDLTDKDKNGND